MKQSLKDLIAEIASADDWTVDRQKQTRDTRSSFVDVDRPEEDGSHEAITPENSMILASHEKDGWKQLFIAGPNGFWVVDANKDGTFSAQSLVVGREGKPYPLEDAGVVAGFEREFQMNSARWPGYILKSKKRFV